MRVLLAAILLATFINAKNRVNINPPHLSQAKIQEYVNKINALRSVSQDCGEFGIKKATHPVKWNYNLYKAAYEHSRDMAMNSLLEHYGSNTKYDLTGKIYGSSNEVLRARANGYKNNDYIGENILYGDYHFGTDEVMESFIEHDEHCPNMMNPRFQDVGVAFYYNPKTGNEFWTVILGVHYVKRYK